MIDAAHILLSSALLLSAAAAAPETASDADAADGVRRFAGTVVEPDGRPVSGASVVFARAGLTDVVELKATTDDRGRFDFSVADDLISSPLGGARVVALKPGFGPAWIDAEAEQNSANLRLKLALDDLPIEGRILTLEGRPVVGATVRAVGIQLFANDDPKLYLAVLKASDRRARNYRVLSFLRLVPFGDRSPSVRSLFANPDAEHPAVPTARTDEQGAFRLTGIGRHRRVLLVISGNAIANTTIEVLTDPLEGLLNGQPPRFSKPTYGARFVHHVRPSRPIVGTVTDAQSGRPIPGALVRQLDGSSETNADASGRFELQGCAKDKKYKLSAGFSWQPTTYIAGYFDIDDAAGLGPLEVQLHVFPAIPLSGRVIDRVTGKPVSAQVLYHPLYPNTHVMKGMPVGGACSETLTKPDGSFSVCVLPGPGALLVRAAGRSRFGPAHVDAEAFFAAQKVRYGSPDLAGVTKDTLVIAAGPGGRGGMSQSQFQGIVLLNVPETAQRLTQDIEVRSKTKSGELR